MSSSVAINFEDLETFYSHRVEKTQTSLELVASGDPKATCSTLNNVRLELAQLKKDIQETKDSMNEWKTFVKKAQILAELCRESYVKYGQVFEAMSAHPRIIQQQRTSQEPVNARGKQTGAGGKTTVNGPKQPGPTQRSLPSNAKVSYLKMQEFESVPKYMKGRMTYNSINAAIDEYNKALDKKYNFYLKGFKSMASIKDKNLYQHMKSLETRETKGLYFLVGDDMKGCSFLKSETNRRNLFTILRHCHRIQEIRGPGHILRYVSLMK